MFIEVTGINLDIALTLVIASVLMMVWAAIIFTAGLFKWHDKKQLKQFFLIMNIFLVGIIAFNIGTIIWLAIRYKSQ